MLVACRVVLPYSSDHVRVQDGTCCRRQPTHYGRVCIVLCLLHAMPMTNHFFCCHHLCRSGPSVRPCIVTGNAGRERHARTVPVWCVCQHQDATYMHALLPCWREGCSVALSIAADCCTIPELDGHRTSVLYHQMRSWLPAESCNVLQVSVHVHVLVPHTPFECLTGSWWRTR